MANNVAYKEASPVISILATIPDHIGELKSNLRAEDAEEILRFGLTIQKALWQSYRQSLVCKTAFIDGEIAAVWGIGGRFLGTTGIPWLMTTSIVKKISPLRFTRLYQEEVIKMLKIFKRLESYVDSEYSSAIRLLDIVGFTIEDPQKIGNGMYSKFWIGK